MARSSPPAKDRQAAIAANVMAAKVAKAQAMGWQVTVTLHGREKRKVRGLVEARVIDGRRKVSELADGQSNLLVRIGGEEIALERIASIARTRVPG